MVALARWIIVFLITQLYWDALVFARRRRMPGKRRLQNSRTRFQQRINRLGQSKINLLRSGRVGKSRALPSGFALLGGHVVDTTNKIIQKRVTGGTAYYSFNDKLGRKPLYIRPGNEVGWNFVVFQDPFYWRGSGHLILLKKVLGINISKSRFQQNILYDAYTISLRVSLHPRVHLRDPIYRRKIRRRQRKFGKVMVKRKQYRKPGLNNPHLRNRKGKLGKRKKRDVISITSLLKQFDGIGDCMLQKLNVTSVLLKIEKQKIYNASIALLSKNRSKS